MARAQTPDEPPSILRFNLDTDPGWSRTGEWAFGHPSGLGGPAAPGGPVGPGGTAFGFPDPTSGATGTNVLGINLNGNYSTTPGPASYLTAGPFNLTGYANTRVQFQRWLNAFFAPISTETVEVSRNGTTWTTVWANGSLVTSMAWTKVQHDIAVIADNQPTVYIRWGHQLTSDGWPGQSGWNLDDIEILGQAGAAAPIITSQPQSRTATGGSTVTFSVGATGLPVPTYRWYFNGSPILGATSSTLTLTDVQPNNVGAYIVTVSNSLGAVTSATATLSSTAPPPVIVTPPSSLLVTAGQSASFRVEATGTEPLKYQWRRNGFPIPGATSSIFTLANTSRTDADSYDVLVSAGLAEVTLPRVGLSVAPTSYATSVAPNPAWDLQLELSPWSVGYAVLPLSDGRTYIAGMFGNVNGVRRTNVARVKADGTLDPTFVPPEIDDAVRVLAVQGDGKIVIAGDFLRVSGLLRPHLARLNPDGSLDAAFAPATGVNTNVLALAVQNDGRILVGGAFNGYSGTARRSLVRLNGDGSLDSSFLALGMSGEVRALVLQSDGKFFAGGSFTGYIDINGSATARDRLARLNPDGTLDGTTFNVASVPTAVVNALALQASGKVVVGGSFSSVGGVPAGNIVRFNTDGSVDIPFTFGASFGAGFNGEVRALAVQDDQAILVGGNFSTFGGGPLASRFARLNPNGTYDIISSAGNFNGPVNSVAVQSDGRLLLGGAFSANPGGGVGSNVPSAFARLLPSGLPDPTFSFSFRSWGRVNTVLALSGGKMLVTGRLNTARGQVTGSGLVRLNPDSTVDPAFNPGGIGALTDGPGVLAIGNAMVACAVVQPDGKILIAGYFMTYNGSSAASIARLNTDGTFDSSFNPGAGLSSGGFGLGTTLALLPGGRVFVGGTFTAASGLPRGRVAVFGANGTLEATFAAGAGANANVYASVVQLDGKILIGGSFTSYNGASANRIARLNTDGTLDSTFTTGTGGNADVSTISLQTDGKILIGGVFTSFNGAARGGVARLNSDGTLDPTFVPPAVGAVSSLVAQEDGRVIVRGSFTAVEGVPSAAYLIRLNSNGTRDTTFVAAGLVSSSAGSSALIMRDDGQLAMQSDGASCFTVTQNASAPSIVAPPSDQSITAGGTATFSVTASSVLPLTYQWLFNGAPVAGANQASLPLTNVQMGQAGSYRVVVTNELGTITSAAATLTVAQVPVLVALGNLSQTYDGTPRPITVTTVPAGVPVVVTYAGSATAPTGAGSYAVAVAVADPNYQGSAAGTLTIAKATATVTLANLSATYDGTSKSATATTSPAGLYLTLTYNRGMTLPTNAGSYSVSATVQDPNYTGTGSGILTIARAPATIDLGSLAVTYDGTHKAPRVVTSPNGLTVGLSYNGSSAAPSNAGSYSIAATILDPNYVGSTTGTLTIAKAAATVTLGGLNVRYDGTPKAVSTATSPAGLYLIVTYNGGTSPPTNVGSYAVVATVNDANYVGSASATQTLSPAVQAIASNPVNDVTYGQQPFTVNATASSGLPVTFSIISGPATISGNAVTITGAGTVVVRAAQAGSANYSPAPNVDQSFTVGKADQTIAFDPVTGATYGNAPFNLSASSSSGLPVTFTEVSGTATLSGSAVTITGMGDVVVRATQAGNENYKPAANVEQTIHVAKAVLSVTAQNATRAYGTENPSLTFTYSGFVNGDTAGTIDQAPTISTSATVASDAGSYPIIAAGGADRRYSITYVAGTLQVTTLGQIISFPPIPTMTYGDADFTPTVSSDSGLAVTLSVANGPASVKGNVVTIFSLGTVTLRATQNGNVNYRAALPVERTFAVVRRTASVQFSNLVQGYDGTPKSVSVSTSPSGIPFHVIYNGSPTPPTYPGSYQVVAIMDDSHYGGMAVWDTLTITIAVLVNHAPVVHGGIAGSAQILLPESLTLSSPSWVTGDLLMPGSPSLQMTGYSSVFGLREASGSPNPSDHQVMLTDGVGLRYLVRRVDPIPMPVLTVPPPPTGTRDVALTSPSSVGDFSTLRHLTLMGTAGLVAVPPGTYGVLSAQGSTGFVLGSAGATTPEVYNLQNLSLHDSSNLVVLGPVVINLASSPSIQVSIGNPQHPEWLTLNVPDYVALNGNMVVNGFIVAPTGMVVLVNGAVVAGVVSDRLIIYSGSYVGILYY